MYFANVGNIWGVIACVVGQTIIVRTYLQEKIASMNPMDIAPLSMLQVVLPMGSGMQNLQIPLVSQLIVKESQLMYVFRKENFKFEVLGGQWNIFLNCNDTT